MALKCWINGDESAKDMLARVLTERPLLLLPPLHRVPLRVGNVVEIVGPSPSAKTEILIQAAITCILPKECNGVHYGGLERLVMYIDLDCCFDILRLSQSLKHHIMETSRSSNQTNWDPNEGMLKYDNMKAAPKSHFDEELFVACMRRFLYCRCYSSFEFLATLKTLRYQLPKESEAHGVGVHFLMIDSIGAFYWVDRASTTLQIGQDNRNSMSLQSVAETVVQEIQKLLQMQPMLVLATKATISGDGYLTSDVKRTFRKWSSEDALDLITSKKCPQKQLYREYMPSVWQLFITHRVLVRVSDEDLADREHQNEAVYVAEWLLPSLISSDKFTVRDAGISMVT